MVLSESTKTSAWKQTLTSFHSANNRKEKRQGRQAVRVEQKQVRLNSPVVSSRENQSYVASAREMLPAAQRFVTITVVYCMATLVLQICPREIYLTIARD